jgi:hypothetical protein
MHASQNAVDLLGTGKPGAIDVADRENYNAPGHHLALFQVCAPSMVDKRSVIGVRLAKMT